VPHKPAEQSMVVMKANPKQGRATAKSDFSYLRSSYLLEYMIGLYTYVIIPTLFMFCLSATSTSCYIYVLC